MGSLDKPGEERRGNPPHCRFCFKQRYARGLCKTHYAIWWKLQHQTAFRKTRGVSDRLKAKRDAKQRQRDSGFTTWAGLQKELNEQKENS